MGSHEKGFRTAVPPEVEERMAFTRVGWVTGKGRQGCVQVDFEGNRHGPLEARVGMGVTALDLADALDKRLGAVLTFEEGDPLRPILLGLIPEESETPMVDALVRDLPFPGNAETLRGLTVNGKPAFEGLFQDGDELTLRCGRSSMVLRRDGTVLLRGTKIEVDAGTLLRLRGGKTQIS